MQIKKDEEFARDFEKSCASTYVEFLEMSIEIQNDIYMQEPREADLTLNYINALQDELMKFTVQCEWCVNDATQYLHDEKNGFQPHCEECAK